MKCFNLHRFPARILAGRRCVILTLLLLGLPSGLQYTTETPVSQPSSLAIFDVALHDAVSGKSRLLSQLRYHSPIGTGLSTTLTFTMDEK